MGFWQELHQRRVYRMAGLYIVGAWLLIQVAEISFDAWGIPESALRYLWTLFLFFTGYGCKILRNSDTIIANEIFDNMIKAASVQRIDTGGFTSR